MNRPDAPGQPPEVPRPPSSRIPTSRTAPPMLEELAAPGAPGIGPTRTATLDQEFDWSAPFHNRLIIGGISMLALLGLTAMVLFVFSRGASEATLTGSISIPTADGTTPTATSRLTAQAMTTTTLRNGPNSSYSILGTVPRGARVDIVGRNKDGTWLQIIFPPGSQLRGWVDASFWEVSGDLSKVAIAGPGFGPSVIVPTTAPGIAQPEPVDTFVPSEDPTDTPEPSETPLETDTPTVIETPEPPATDTPPPADTPLATPQAAATKEHPAPAETDLP